MISFFILISLLDLALFILCSFLLAFSSLLAVFIFDFEFADLSCLVVFGFLISPDCRPQAIQLQTRLLPSRAIGINRSKWSQYQRIQWWAHDHIGHVGLSEGDWVAKWIQQINLQERSVKPSLIRSAQATCNTLLSPAMSTPNVLLCYISLAFQFDKLLFYFTLRSTNHFHPIMASRNILQEGFNLRLQRQTPLKEKNEYKQTECWPIGALHPFTDHYIGEEIRILSQKGDLLCWCHCGQLHNLIPP